jgi:hypothetical protein
MLCCIDFAFGAEKMSKSIDEAIGYETVLLELENAKGEFLTLARHLNGGDVAVHRTRIQNMKGDGERILARIIHEGGRRNGRAVGVAQTPEGP